MFDRLEFWKEKGMNPKVIYDIGAHQGVWTRFAQKVFPDAKIFAFEGNAEHMEKLQDISANIVLLGSENKKDVAFYKNMVGCTTGNSIYLEQTIYFTPQNAIIEVLPMVRLDDFIQQHTIPIPEFIKLDVQGAELDILKGMGNLLKEVKYVVIEASLHKYNRGAPMIEDVIFFMKLQSFDIIDFVELHKINGYLAQVDILFAHSSTGLRKEHFYDGHLNFS